MRFFSMSGGLVFLMALGAQAAPGDTLKIKAYDDVPITTDPKGSGRSMYYTKVLFPPKAQSFRRLFLRFEMGCHPERRCGEWDTSNHLYLVRRNKQTPEKEELTELMRLITPYGFYWKAEDKWRFGWNYELTDFLPVLRDSVELAYRHNGWENSADRGWTIDLTFRFVEGPPIRQPLGWTVLPWKDAKYGDPKEPITKSWRPYVFTPKPETHSLRVQLIQTGHGNDKQDGCAEFCAKHRSIYLNKTRVSKRYLWRKCGFNALFPQAGTWPIDRGNWCPGELVHPDNYEMVLENKQEQTLRVEMEPYLVDTAKVKDAQGMYQMTAYLFEYGAPSLEWDASVEEVIAPNSDPLYNRYNPICGEPIVVIQNSGTNTLNAVRLRYRLLDGPFHEHVWQGTLKTMQRDTVTLKGLLDWHLGQGIFEVGIESVNGYEDEYAPNNVFRTTYLPPPMYDSDTFDLDITTNKASDKENTMFLRNLTTDEVVFSDNHLVAEDAYLNKIPVVGGSCYVFVFSDEGRAKDQKEHALKNAEELYADGLYFWFRKVEGRGDISFPNNDLRSGKKFIRYNPDFGSRITHAFTTAGKPLPYKPTSWQLFKKRAKQKLRPEKKSSPPRK